MSSFKNADDLFKTVSSSKQLPNFFVIYGNPFDSIENLNKVLQEKVAKSVPQIDTISLNGAEIDPATFHAELSTIPMFDSGRIILLRHADNLLKKIDANKTILGYFVRDFKNLYDKTWLIAQVESGKLPASLSILLENAFILEDEKIRPHDIPDIIKSRVHKTDFEISDEAVMEMTRKYSLNPNLLYKALDNLFLYCLHEKKITKEDVDEISYDIEGDLIFEIVDAISRRDINKSLVLFQSSEMTNGAGFAAFLCKFFTDLFRYKKLKDLSLGAREIHDRLEFNTKHSFIFRKNEERFTTAIRNYSAEEIQIILEKLFELDKNIKEISSVDMQKNIFTAFIISLQKRDLQ